jgi:hypothetical protein
LAQPKHRKMDMRFGTWSVRSLYRSGTSNKWQCFNKNHTLCAPVRKENKKKSFKPKMIKSRQ